jgi:pyruvate formate lyase activating enzyme
MRLTEGTEGDDRLRCNVCPHSCLISPGNRGTCGVRENRDGKISLVTYGIISAMALDPIEKKPLYHFFPGSSILSVGSYGCNLICDFCQNYHISQHTETNGIHTVTPETLIKQALKTHGNLGIAYTYNEPVIWYEYVKDCSRLASSQGLRNVMVTNGYINPVPLTELIRVTDAFNVDLKGFSNEFYRRYTGATLKPVLDAIKTIASSGRHLEITTLILPGLNDSPDEMRREAEWIAENAGTGVPLHLSRYFPMYRRNDPQTPADTILRLREIAEEYLNFVYTGNMPSSAAGSDTVCPKCKTVVIKRSGYQVDADGLTDEGCCSKCGEEILEWI